MKLALVSTIIWTFTLGLYTPKVMAAPAKTPKTFTEWCQQKNNLPKETKLTVEVLLKKAGRQNCNEANQILTKLTSLDFWGDEISDITPLSNLNNLTSLEFVKNKISDIKPLSKLTKLTSLHLSDNPLISKKCPLQPESICRF